MVSAFKTADFSRFSSNRVAIGQFAGKLNFGEKNQNNAVENNAEWQASIWQRLATLFTE